MTELTRQEIAKEAATHKRFSEADVNNYWTTRAREYARQYDGTFGFMKSVKRDYVDPGKVLSPGQVKAILNCARKEGEELELNKLEKSVSIIPIPAEIELAEIDEILNPGMNLSGAPVEDLQSQIDSIEIDFDFEIDDDETVEPSPHVIELNRINKKIKEIQDQMQSIAPGLGDLTALIETSEKEEQVLFEDFQKKIAEVRESRRQAEIDKISIQSQLRQIEIDLENQRRLHALTLQQIAAEQAFVETKKQFEELREGQPWDDAIFPFQWDDVCFMAANFLAGKNGVLNANDMGLGKTFETGALIDILQPLFQQKYNRQPLMIWLTKKTLRYSTFKELRRWNPERQIIVLDGNETAREFQLELAVASNIMVIANYDMMNTTSILKYDWDFVFMDEVHKLKGGANSRPTAIFENAVKLVNKAKFFVPLSGSPIQNHPKEMWCYLHLFAPDRFPNVRNFERNYCFGWGQKDENGKAIVQVDWEKIIRAMKDRVIRHSKQECLPDLPDKVREFRYVEMEGQQAVIYAQLRDEFFVWLDDQKQESLTATSILAQLTRLRQAAIIPASMRIRAKDGSMRNVDCYESAKIDECMEIVEQTVGAGDQIVVFSSQFNEPLFEVKRRVSDLGFTCETLSGENSNRFEQIENAFQQGETQVLLVNMKTGGEGLNLQKSDKWPGGANNAIFLDLWWNPKFNEQAEDRLHRQGQKDAVTIHILQAENSVDAFIAAKLEEKEVMISGIMGSDELRKGSDWRDVLQGLI